MLWTCEINERDSPDSESCTANASAMAEVDVHGVIKIITTTPFVKELCTKCKATDTWLQSPFYKVSVVGDCNSVDCSTATGKFMDYYGPTDTWHIEGATVATMESEGR